MPAASVFFDSNYLIYQRDASDPAKHGQARQWTSDLLSAGQLPTATGWQCLREYYSVMIRKKLADRATVMAEIRIWSGLVSSADCDDFERAWRIEDAHGFSFYDCLVLASALNAGATIFLTEDLQHGRLVDGMRIVNPFTLRLQDLGVI